MRSGTRRQLHRHAPDPTAGWSTTPAASHPTTSLGRALRRQEGNFPEVERDGVHLEQRFMPAGYGIRRLAETQPMGRARVVENGSHARP